MKIMVPYEEPTDTCPDCSDIPCDCGLPAGYKADIRFAANFAPHIKVIEATKVAEIIEQRDDLLRYNEAYWQDALICANCDAISVKEYKEAIEQLTAAREEIERLQCAGIHSCHDNCERPNCVLRRQLKTVTEQRDGLRAGIDCASDQLRRVTEQRDEMTLRWELTNDSLFDKRALADRLAEALESIIGEAAFEGIPESKQQSIYEALQSLNQDHTVATNDMIAAVKGGADES